MNTALVAYMPTALWDVCQDLTVCENGTHTVYVKYYTSFGVGNNASKVSDSITLTIPVVSVNTEVNTEVNISPGSAGLDATTSTEVAPVPSTGSGIGGIISSIISDIFGGGNSTIETTVPSTTDTTLNTAPDTTISTGDTTLTPSVSGGGGLSGGGSGNITPSSNSGGGTSGNQIPFSDTVGSNTTSRGNTAPIAPSQNNSQGVIVTTVIPTATTITFNEPAIKSLSQARESAVIIKPVIENVNKSITGGSITFIGKGIPGSKVALFIHSDQVVVYTTDVDSNGKWSFKHDQGNVELAPGEHSVFAVTYDPGSKVKSKPSLVETFEVKQNMAAVVLSYVDLPTTLLTLLACIFGAVYIGTRKRKVAQ